LPAFAGLLKKISRKNFGVLSYEKNLYRNTDDLLLGTKKYYRPAGQRLVVLVCSAWGVGCHQSRSL
jgi:hypothetical protein